MNHLPALLVVVPLFFAVAAPLVDIVHFGLRRFWAFAGVLLHLAVAVGLYRAASMAAAGGMGPLVYPLGGWPAPYGISLIADRAGGLLGLMTAFGTLVVVIYSLASIHGRDGKYYVLVELLAAGMSGVAVSGDVFTLYVFLELVASATYGLVTFERTRYSLEAGFRYMTFGALSSTLMLFAIMLVYRSCGTLNMAHLAVLLPTAPRPAALASLVLFVVGFGLRVGLVPLHTWLPDAHGSGPSAVSALLSGVSIKASVYALARVALTVYHGVDSGVGEALVVLGGLSILVGHLMALRQTHLKRLLAYSTVAQVGYIVMGIGLGTREGVAAAAFHVANHAVMKTGLFLSAGILGALAGTFKIRGIGGTALTAPYTTISFIACSLAIIGVPPFAGFVSKWQLVDAAYSAGRFLAGSLVPVGTVISAVYYFRLAGILIFGGHREHGLIHEPVPRTFALVPVVALALASWAMGIFYRGPLSAAFGAADDLLDAERYVTAVLRGGVPVP